MSLSSISSSLMTVVHPICTQAEFIQTYATQHFIWVDYKAVEKQQLSVEYARVHVISKAAKEVFGIMWMDSNCSGKTNPSYRIFVGELSQRGLAKSFEISQNNLGDIATIQVIDTKLVSQDFNKNLASSVKKAEKLKAALPENYPIELQQLIMGYDSAVLNGGLIKIN